MHRTIVRRNVLTPSQKLDFTAILHSKSFYRKDGWTRLLEANFHLADPKWRHEVQAHRIPRNHDRCLWSRWKFRLLGHWHVSGFSTQPLLWLKMWPETWPKWNMNHNWILNYKMASLWIRACWWSPHQYLCSQRQFYAVVHHICSTEKIYCHSLETIWRKPWWMWISVRVPLVDWGWYNGDVFFFFYMKCS